MTERAFRLILGLLLFVLLAIENQLLFIVYITLLFFEGITNWRLPILISKLRYGKHFKPVKSSQYKFSFESERAMRLVFGGMLTCSLFLLPSDLWYLNWMLPTFLTLAGIVNMCPVVLSLRWLGFR